MPASVSLIGLHPRMMLPRVEALLADPEAMALGLFVRSGFRSIYEQQVLWQNALVKYGDPTIAAKWVARPGHSNHGPKVDGFGVAVDIGVPDVYAPNGQWPAALEAKINRVAARHGLRSPLEWEDWHYEPDPAWKPPQEEDDLMRTEFLITVPPPDAANDNRQIVTKGDRVEPNPAPNVNLGLSDSKTSSVTVKASGAGKMTTLLVQPWRLDFPAPDILALAVSNLDGTVATPGRKARIIIEHR